MNYSTNDYVFLGRQVAAGKYITKTSFFLSIAIAFFVGGLAASLVFSNSFTDKEIQQPLSQTGQQAAGQLINKDMAANILQHETEAVKNPDNAENWKHLGHLYFDSNMPEKAIHAYEKYLALQPKDPDVLTDCGVMYRELKNFEKALALFKQAHSIDPKHEQSLFNQGVILYSDLGNKEEGLAVWHKLVKQNPNAKTPQGDLVSQMLKKLEAK